jgi:cbb3-type cytochrome oxidase subunit 3
MLRETLQHIDWNIATELSLVIFVIVFIAVLVRAIRHERAEVDYWGRMPLSDAPDTESKPAAKV